MAYNKQGYYRRALVIQEITRKYYEPERHDKCFKAVWRKHIRGMFGICYDTYIRYLKATPPQETPKPTATQLTLFEEM